MTFSRSAAVNVTPLLARIVLALLFIPAGYSKLGHTNEFTGEDAAILRFYEVGDKGASDAGDPADPAASAAPAPSSAAIVAAPVASTPSSAAPGLASLAMTAAMGATQDSEGAEDAIGAAAEDLAEGASEAAQAAEDVAEAIGEAAQKRGPDTTGLSREPLDARAMHKVTIMLAKHDLPYPVVGAWLAAITELVGGILLVLGLFTRVWGVGLAFAMGMAFYLTTWQYFGGADFFSNLMSFLPEGNLLAFNTLGAQLALGVLSLGVVFSGAGTLSLDHLLFGRRRNKGVIDDDGDFSD